MKPRVIVTCGPSFEPIDAVRRITNFSTGELGLLLANQLTRAGFRVLCLKGSGATAALACEAEEVRSFTTNADLLGQLETLGPWREPVAFFHVAALSDFRVRLVTNAAGDALPAAKISSSEPSLVLTLEPAPKILSRLRMLFPAAALVGWKYQMDGGRAEALAQAARQLERNFTDLCVVNGAAWGDGFGICLPGGGVAEHPDKAGLCSALIGWLRDRLDRRSS